MAYFSGTNEQLTVYGPEDLIAGVAESRELAEVWRNLLAERESEIRSALDEEDFTAAERIWREVEAAARAQLAGP